MAIEIELVDRVMHLTDGERAELALHLLISLDTDRADPDAGAAWEAEIERRLTEVDQGTATLFDSDESISRARSAISKGRNR